MKKSFEEIYEEINANSSDVLRKEKGSKNKKILITLLICVVVNIIIAIFDTELIILAGTIALSALVLILIMNKEDNKFRKLYKKLIIAELIKKYDERLDYTPKIGVSKFDYSASHFDNSFDNFFSEDRIFGTIGKNSSFEMSQVITKEVKKDVDKNGNKTVEETTTFNGLYGLVKLEKNVNTKIHIVSNSITRKYNKKRIEMDSTEFEEKYDCLADDKLVAMKIFTADLLEKFVNLNKEKINDFEVKIEGGMLYFRYRSGDFFEPPKMKDVLDKDTIKKYYGIVSFPVELVEKIIENINEL